MPENENPTLREAVEKAANEQGIIEKPEGQEQRTESVNEEDKKESGEFPKGESVEIDSEIEEAINFYRALRDPNQQKTIIQELALRAGLLQPKETLSKKEEVRYGDMLNEILGEEYPDLKDKLGKVFQQFEKENDAKLNYVRAEVEMDRRQRDAVAFEQEFADFLSSNKITEDVAGKMLKEIQELPPSVGPNGKRIPLTTYLNKIHKLVVGEQKVVEKEVERVKKVQQNLKERSTNLSSDISDDRLKKGSRLPSLKEAIQAASEGIKFDE